MPKTKEQINIARLVYDAYPHSDLLPIDPEQDCRSLESLLAKVTRDNIGDSLFRFIIVEIREGGGKYLGRGDPCSGAGQGRCRSCIGCSAEGKYWPEQRNSVNPASPGEFQH